jgi:large subunit ribosomal protein L15
MLQLDNLEKITKNRKRVGRGGSRGGTSGRGSNGQRSRSGGKTRNGASFEGGQMSLTRRLPKRGFKSRNRVEFELINLKALEVLFETGQTVSSEQLIESGIIKGCRGTKTKLLADGEITKSLTISVDAASVAAIKSVEKAGGKVILAGG